MATSSSPGAATAAVQQHRGLALVLVAVASVVPVLVATYPPLYDYYHWAFAGRVVAGLLFGVGFSPAALAGYQIHWGPIPNLLSPLLLGCLNLVLDPLAAGRAYVAFSVVTFGLAFAYLVRGVQQRATAVELFGFAWAYGYFLYKGYLGYLLALGFALFVVALLHRLETGSLAPRRSALFVLGLLVTWLFLCHLMAWAVAACAVAVHAVRRARLRGAGAAARLATTLLPSIGLLAWYLAGRDQAGLVLYGSLADKLRSMIEPLLLFLRTDPLPPPFPVFWANLLALALLAVLLAASRARGRPRFAAPWLLAVAAALAMAAAVIPFQDAGGMGRPDERFVLPAAALAAASLRLGSPTRVRTAASAVIVLAVLALHALEYARASRKLAEAAATLGAAAAGERMAAFTITDSALEPCVPETGVSIGTPLFKWFPLVHLLETGGGRANLLHTSLLESPSPIAGPLDVLVRVARPGRLAYIADGRTRGAYPYLFVAGCAADLQQAQRQVASDYRPMAAGEGFVLLRSRH